MKGEIERLSALQDCFTLISSTICCMLMSIWVCHSWANWLRFPVEMMGEGNLHCSNVQNTKLTRIITSKHTSVFTYEVSDAVFCISSRSDLPTLDFLHARYVPLISFGLQLSPCAPPETCLKLRALGTTQPCRTASSRPQTSPCFLPHQLLCREPCQVPDCCSFPLVQTEGISETSLGKGGECKKMKASYQALQRKMLFLSLSFAFPLPRSLDVSIMLVYGLVLQGKAQPWAARKMTNNKEFVPTSETYCFQLFIKCERLIILVQGWLLWWQ